jgi:tetratricopeptide (TPR) repeat protein
MDPVVTRGEVENKIANMGDYVKIDYLARLMKGHLDFDTRKFVMLKLAKIYEERNIFIEAAKLMRGAADINTTFDGKMSDFVKSAELFVKGGEFNEADVSFARANACANTLQKVNIKNVQKELYQSQVREYAKKGQRQHALKTYEKLLTLDLSPNERALIQTELMKLYEQLGKIKEFYDMKRALN